MVFKIQPKPAQSDNHDRFDVLADGLGRYTIDVSLPVGYESNGRKYPVILITDGNCFFDLTQAVVNGAAARMGAWLAPSIVVGVGYPADEGRASFCARRNFDFHGEWDMADSVGQRLQRAFVSLKNAEGRQELEIHAGGYARFMAFLRDELMPSLAEIYPIDSTSRQTLIGDSSGGHFVLRALYDPKSPFSRYVCISPSFGAAEGAIQKAEAEYAATHRDLDVDLFMCAGRSEVDQNPTDVSSRFGSGIIWVAEQFAMRKWPNARVHWEIMNNENHHSIAPRGIATGLRFVYRLLPGMHPTEIKQAVEQAAMTRYGKRDLTVQ